MFALEISGILLPNSLISLYQLLKSCPNGNVLVQSSPDGCTSPLNLAMKPSWKCKRLDSLACGLTNNPTTSQHSVGNGVPLSSIGSFEQQLRPKSAQRPSSTPTLNRVYCDHTRFQACLGS